MNLKLVVACLATALLAGCSKCSQQPQTEAPAATEATAAQTAAPAAQPVEAGTAESAAPKEAMPSSEQINEELPPAEESGKQNPFWNRQSHAAAVENFF